MQKSLVRRICLFAFFMNFILFGVKLYIGLSTNSIGIFSDAINNLFDSLSGVLTFICMTVVMKSGGLFPETAVKKTEQLCSFLMAIAITFTGLYFAYSSLERFMYPTAVWYTNLYLGVLIGTALVKLFMFITLKNLMKKEKSPVAHVMSADSLLDFGITMTTVITLWVSAKGTFAVDAAAGLAISTVIVVSAVKTVIKSGAKLINFVPLSDREDFLEGLTKVISEDKISSVTFLTEENTVTAFVSASADDETQKKAADAVKEISDIKIIFTKEI